VRRRVPADPGRHRRGRPPHGRPPERRLDRRAGRARPRALARRGCVRDRTPQPPERAGGQMTKRMWALLAVLAVAAAFPAAGATRQSGGTLKMVAWEGYLEPGWVKPFEKQSGCTVQPKYATSSDEMVTLMRSGGGGQYDMVSASGDASLRLIYGKDVQPVNTSLVPGWRQFFNAFKSPPNNTVDGKHYGISLQWGPNTRMYTTQKVTAAPTSWGALYRSKYKGRVTVPNNPIQIADVALYLSKTQPGLGIKDPYELNQKQFDAAISLIKKQKPLVKKYWGLSSDEVSL